MARADKPIAPTVRVELTEIVFRVLAVAGTAEAIASARELLETGGVSVQL